MERSGSPSEGEDPSSKFERNSGDSNRIASLLSKKLGPEHLSTRQAHGGTRVTYIEGWRAIALANEVFGYDGWSSEIKQLNVDFLDVNPDTGKISAGVTAHIKVSVKHCKVVHEDIGYGSIEGARSKGDAMDKCKKEAVTDGLKRALRNFGSLLGNCIYDKSHISEVSKIKAIKPKFNFSDIYGRGDPSSESNKASTSAAVPPTRPIPPPPAIPHVEPVAQHLKEENVPDKESDVFQDKTAKQNEVKWTVPQEEIAEGAAGLGELCDDVDFSDDLVPEDSGVGLEMKNNKPYDKRAPVTPSNPYSNRSFQDEEPDTSSKLHAVDRTVSRPILRSGAPKVPRDTPIKLSEDFAQAAGSPDVTPEYGGFKSAKTMKRTIDLGAVNEADEPPKRSKTVV